MRELRQKLKDKNYDDLDISWFFTLYWWELIPPIIIWDGTERSDWMREEYRKDSERVLQEALIEVDFWPYKEDR